MASEKEREVLVSTECILLATDYVDAVMGWR